MPSPTSLGCCRALAAIALWLVASVALAQSAPGRTERPDPLDPQARVPSATHTSSLASYRRLGDDPRTPWREANETVNRIGGWRTYLRQAQQPDPAASAPAASAPAGRSTPAPAAGPAPSHGAHGGHKPR
jgi:hypothetical protein